MGIGLAKTARTSEPAPVLAFTSANMTRDAEVKAGTFLPVRGHVGGRTFRADSVICVFFFFCKHLETSGFYYHIIISTSYPHHIHIYHDLADLGGTNIVEGDRLRGEGCHNN